jgi:hypothetical protein
MVVCWQHMPAVSHSITSAANTCLIAANPALCAVVPHITSCIEPCPHACSVPCTIMHPNTHISDCMYATATHCCYIADLTPTRPLLMRPSSPAACRTAS